jgi:hypothetical protein
MLPAYRVGQRHVRVKRDDLARVITPAKSTNRQIGKNSAPPQAAGIGMREVTSVDEIRPLTPEERDRALAAIARATRLREELREKYGVFEPPAWELLNEARRERTEQLP